MRYKFSILFAILSLYSFFAFSQTVEFVENRGQWDNRVKYMGKVPAGAFFVESNGFTVVQHNPEEWARQIETAHGHRVEASSAKEGQTTLHSHAFKVTFEGGNPAAEIIADKPLYTYNNYFIGNDPSKWASGCKSFQGITVKNIYPNVDLRYYAGDGNVKYDFIVHPGGDPSAITLNYQGANGLEVQKGVLHIKTSVGDLKELEPYTYQYNEAGRVQIANRYVVKGAKVSFKVKEYNLKTTLVIDPSLVFCSFSGSTQDNWGFTATYGPDGSMYGGGIVSALGFPVSPGAFQSSWSGGGGEDAWDMGIIKLSPDGSKRIYATYIGGNQGDFPHSLVVDKAGNLVIAGRTNSPSTGPGAYPLKGVGAVGSCEGFDIVVTKLNADGTALIGSARVGGSGTDGANINPSTETSPKSLLRNYGDNGRSEVIIDAGGNICVASSTQSLATGNGGFPVTPNAFQKIPGTQSNADVVQDGVVLRFNPDLSTLLLSSFLGGNGNDAAYVLAVSPKTGNLYVGGGTESTDLLPGTRNGSLGPSNFGRIDGFLVELDPSGSTVIKSTYIGTGGDDQVYGVQFDQNGYPYVMGQTSSTWPVINAPWNQPNGKQFIAKLQPDLSGYVYSTSFGKGNAAPDISPVAFLVDRCENVYISGWGGKIGGTLGSFAAAGVDGLPVTPDAFKPTPDINAETGTGWDFYFFVLKKDAASQLYGTFFGQNGGIFPDHVDGGTSRFDPSGVVYQAICASCENNLSFPTTLGSWSPTKPPSAGCNLAMVKIAFNLDGVRGKIRSSIRGIPRKTNGCVPLTVDFVDTIQQAKSYEWNFGDGTPTVRTTNPNIQYTFNNVGTYNVMMIAIDSDKCITRDTSYVQIKAGNNRADLNFNPVKLSPPCDIFKYRFDNTSGAPPGIPFKTGTFTWDFGDGSPTQSAGTESLFHTYAAAGAYNVRLWLDDTAYCNTPDTVTKIVRVAANVKASFTTPATGCAPYDAVFENTSQGGAQFTWDFGDGGTSTDQNPVHTYLQPGTYLVQMTAVDSNTCNIIDKTSFSIAVNSVPTADFSASPQPPLTNTPIVLTNLSSADAVRFKWVFGDGDSLLTSSRSPLTHDYNLSDTYNACLTAYNAAGCAAQVCRQVTTLVEPAVDVPNAFTPLSNDVNSAVYVRGYGIARMHFAVYARWGEKVFETSTKKIGWDGRYKGQLLPMDAYAYVLDVEFVDGKKYQKKGDITLIR